VYTIFAAVRTARRGETYIPRVPSARILDVARALVGDRKTEIRVTGIRPGEKIHEILVSEEEAHRTVDRGEYYAIRPILPELCDVPAAQAVLTKEYSSSGELMNPEQIRELLVRHRLRVEDALTFEGEMLA
jgi:UDP-glucose 4-epimerase